MPRNFRYWGFISYSHADRAQAERLHAALEGYRVPTRLVGLDGPFGPAPARLQPIFRDRDELNAGGELGATVRQALEVSRSLIVVCSPNAAASHWVDAEAETFRHLHPDGPVICVWVGENPALALEECLPPALKRRLVAMPGLSETAPIAVDLRAGGDGLRKGVQKIVAGLTGLPLDQLVQRDAQRRHRRMAALAATLAAVSLAMGALAFSAYRSRDEARFQRAQAEGLIEFMLVDLRKKLEPHGRLDALDAVGDRALRYYDAQKPKSLDPDALGRRARALHLIGEINDRRGDTKAARAAFAQARTSTAELLERSPEDPKRLYDHAQSVFWNGYIDWQYGDTAAAERSFAEYGRLARKLSAKDEANPDWLAEVGYAHSNLGTLLLEQGRAAEAVPEFRKSLGINRKRATLPGDVASIQLDIAQDRSWLSSAYFANRQLRPAIAEREMELEIYDRLLKTSPDDALPKERKMMALRLLGEMNLAAGFLDSSRQEIEASILLAQEQRRLDSENTAWQKSLAKSLVLASEQARRDGSIRAAQAHLDAAAGLLAEHLKKDPGAWAWRVDLQESIAAEQGKLYLQGDQVVRAGQVLRASRQRLNESPTPSTLRYRVANKAMLARLAATQGDQAAESVAWRNVIVLAGARAKQLDGNSALSLVEAWQAVGRVRDAEELNDNLRSAGYGVQPLQREVAQSNTSP